MLSSSSLLCLRTVFVDEMGFIALPPLPHLFPVPSHDGRQYRPHARLQIVVGRRSAQAEGGYQERFGGWGGGRYGCGGNGFFINALCIQIRTILKQKKIQGKNRTMQRYGQVLPPCCCIAGITAGEHICCRFLRNQRGRRGGEVISKIGRGAHLPCPKSFSCFRALFLKALEAPMKKRKRSETARPQFRFWIKIRVNPIYLVIIFFMVATPIDVLEQCPWALFL